MYVLLYLRQNALTDSWQLNYLTKYLELIDTCFLFLKKKPLSMRAISSHSMH